MYMMDFAANALTNLTMSNNDAVYPTANMATRWTEEFAQSTTNTTTITFTAAQLTDVILFNVSAIAGTVTIKDAASLTVLATETLDFFTATSAAYMATGNLVYDKNIRAFHGDQIYFDVKVEITLEADVGSVVKVGVIAAGLFVRYGATERKSALAQKRSYKVFAKTSEYRALLELLSTESPMVVHVGGKFDDENLYLGYGLFSISNVEELGRFSRYDLELKEK